MPAPCRACASWRDPFLFLAMKKVPVEMKIGINGAIFVCAPLLVLLSLLSAYLFHPYAAVAAMFASALALFWLSNKADGKGIARVAGYSCAFACLLFIAALPSGEIGAKRCPDYVANPGAEAKISYFYSPFCPNCPAQESELNALLASGADFRLEKYDLRYCRENADKYGFSGTPCIAIEKDGHAEKGCGLVPRERMAAALTQLG